MNDVSFFWVAFVAYMLAMFALVVAVVRRGAERTAAVGRALVWVGLVAHTVSIVWRAFILGTQPLHQFLPRLGRAFGEGPAWHAAVYVLIGVVAVAALALGIVFRRKRAVWLIGAGIAVFVEIILLDFLDFARLPIEKVYEYLSIASWCAALALLAFSPRLRLVVVDAALALTACLLVVFAAIQPKSIELQLVPALQSYWLFIHVSLTSLGFAIFGMAFAIAALFVVKACDPKAATPATRRGVWTSLGIAAAIALVLVLVATLSGKGLPFKEVAYAPHEIKQATLPAAGATQFLRYASAAFGAFVFWAYVAFWVLWGIRSWRSTEREASGIGHYAFVVTALAFFAACLAVASSVRRGEDAIRRVGDEHEELVRIAEALLPADGGALTKEAVENNIKEARARSRQARGLLSARWLPLTADKQPGLANDPDLPKLMAFYKGAGHEWKLPIRYKDIKTIGRTLGKQAGLTEAVATRIAFPADRAALQKVEKELRDEYRRRQAGALLPRSAVGQLAAYVGLSTVLAVPLAALLWWAGGRLRERLPDAKRLDGISHAAIAVAYPVFTFGAIFAGAIWAHFAWGAWWSWDPKEVGSLVAWFLYTLYVHQRYREGITPRGAAVMGMLGFLAAVLSLAGNNFIGGLHSYS